MIKVTRKDKVQPPKKDKYPCLMMGNAGSIVLMTSAVNGMGEGVLLEVDNGISRQYLYKNTGKWPLSEFTLYAGKFIIENKL